MLKTVLEAFQGAESLSLLQMARRLGVEVSALEGMIQFWVRKGKLREVCSAGCAECGHSTDCGLIQAVARRYELVREPVTGRPVG